ncbi:MAG: Gfo/Idh/MocA family oxidoreductase [bacterium]
MFPRHPTRREFIKSAAIAAATAPLVARDLHARPPEKKLGFALVGLGSLSTYQIAPALQKTHFCRLAGIVTGTPAKAIKWKAQYGIPDHSVYNYDTMESMAGNPEIDVVYVVTPNALHADHTIKAAKARKHVLCEKPMEVSVSRCESMIDACRKARRQLAIGYRCQFEPHHLECVRLAREKTFGTLKSIDAGFGFPIGDPTQWRMNRALAGGGPLMDVGIYALQASRMLTHEEPVSVSAHTTKTDPAKFRDVEETMTFDLTFPSGVVSRCTTSYSFGVNKFAATAERGGFGMEPAFNYSGNRAWRSDGKPLRFDEIDVFAAEMDDFARCIIDGKPTRVPGEEGLRDIRVMMALYDSARANHPVKLS